MIRAVLTTGLSASALPSWSSAGASLFLSESPPCSHRHGDDWGDGDDDDEESDNYDDGDEKPELPEWWVHHLLVEVGQVEPGDHHVELMMMITMLMMMMMMVKDMRKVRVCEHDMKTKMCNCNIADPAGSWNEDRERTLRGMGGILITIAMLTKKIIMIILLNSP